MPATIADRMYNFSAGPAVLPVTVLEQIRDEMLALPGVGSSVLEISHRSKAFDEILNQTEASLRELLSIPEGYSVLFLQGGSRLQFSMIPLNFLQDSGRPADYLITGTWGKSALAEAKKVGEARVAWDGSPDNFNAIPSSSDPSWSEDSAYVHYTSNETIQGVQFTSEPECGTSPLICDASSDFLSRPLDISRYGMIYACAQKNAGPAGVTIAIIKDELLEQGADTLPGYLLYRNHAKAKSCYNTPPTFAVYVVGLIAKWLLNEVGGLAAIEKTNGEKAAKVYGVIDQHDTFYRGHAKKDVRSKMNVTFLLPTEELETQFLSGAKTEGLTDLKGHRSVGGIRASIYNAMPVEGVDALTKFMQDFANKNS